MQTVGAVILAGGRSSRMGSNKALLKLGEKSIIQTQVEELSRFYKEITVVSNQPQLYSDLGVRVIRDDYPGSGPLAGIHAGLKGSTQDAIFVLPCDMPFVPGDLGLKLLEIAGNADGVVLEKDGHLEPLCALYGKTCLPTIEQFLATNRRKVIDFYPFRDIKIVSLTGWVQNLALDTVFFNINTPDEFATARSMRTIGK